MEDPKEQRLTTLTECQPKNDIQTVHERAWVLSVITRANELASAVDSSSMVHGLLDLMIEITLANSANFFQLDPTTDELVITHVRGDAESKYLIGLRVNRQQGMPGISLCDPKMMVVGDLPSDPDWLRTVDPVNAARKKNVINLPIATKDHTLGIIQIFNYQQVEMDLLVVLAARLAGELDHRGATETIIQSNQRLLSLVGMLGEVAGTLDRNQLLHMVAENAARLVDAERSSLFLVKPSTSEMVFQVAYKSPEQDQASSSDDQNGAKEILYGSGQQNPSRSTSRRILKKEQFSYFNRSVITVPLQSEPLSQESCW